MYPSLPESAERYTSLEALDGAAEDTEAVILEALVVVLVHVGVVKSDREDVSHTSNSLLAGLVGVYVPPLEPVPATMFSLSDDWSPVDD